MSNYHFTYQNLATTISSSSGPTYITEEEFCYEKELVCFALDRAYAGKGVIAEHLFLQVQQQLTNLQWIKYPALWGTKLGEILSTLPDAHLSVMLDQQICYQAKIEKRNVGKNRNQSDKPWKGFINNDIYTIAISSFPFGKWPGFAEFICEARDKARTIIIDVRGNGGGDSTNAHLMANLLANQEVPLYAYGARRRNTPEAITIFKNLLHFWQKHAEKNSSMLETIEKYISILEEKLQQALQGDLAEFTEEYDQETDLTYNPHKGFQGKIYILQDKGCASSGENAILAFNFFPNVEKVGFNSQGLINFGDIGSLQLPHSKLILGIATFSTIFRGKKVEDFIGIKPDIILEDGQDAFEYVYQLESKNSI